MTSHSHPDDFTRCETGPHEKPNVPATKLLIDLEPDLASFMARILSVPRGEAGSTYRRSDADVVQSGELGAVVHGEHRMLIRVARERTATPFGPIPGHFGVFFTVSYEGYALEISDLTILVPVDLNGNPDSEAWIETRGRNGSRIPPRREVCRFRDDPPARLYELLRFVVEQGITHAEDYVAEGTRIAPGVFQILDLKPGIGPDTSPGGDAAYKLWSRLLIGFEEHFRDAVQRQDPLTPPIHRMPFIEGYPDGEFAHIKFGIFEAILKVVSLVSKDDNVLPTAEIEVSFRQARYYVYGLRIVLVIDTTGLPLQVLFYDGYAVTGEIVTETAATSSWYDRSPVALAEFSAYLVTRMTEHLAGARQALAKGDSVISYADDDAPIRLDRPVIIAPRPTARDTRDVDPPESPALSSLRQKGARKPSRADSNETARDATPVPLFTPLDPAALAGKTPVAIYDFTAIAREMATQSDDEDGERLAPGQIQMISRLHRLGAEGATRWLEHGHAAMIEALADVGQRAPHFGPVTDFILTYVRASANTGAPLRLPPTLIVDEPGTGKTWYLSRLAAALGVPFASVSMAAITTGDTIQGSHPIWRNASQGIVSKLLLTHVIANGVVFVDEFDKPTENGGPRGSLYRPYYAALERENARCFTDDFLGLAMNASHLIWVLAANAIEPLPEPIQDRVTQVKLAPMTAAHRRIVAASIYRDCNADYAGWYHPEIGEAALAVLEAHTPRQMRKAIDHALARAGADNRRILTAADLTDGLALSRISERQGAIGFTATR